MSVSTERGDKNPDTSRALLAQTWTQQRLVNFLVAHVSFVVRSRLSTVLLATVHLSWYLVVMVFTRCGRDYWPRKREELSVHERAK